MQQLPHPLEEPKEGEDRTYYDFWERFEIRKLFIAEEGYSFITADYTSLERYLTAHLSQDKVLCDILENNRDSHSTVAKIVFPELKDVPVENIKKEYPAKRQLAKKISFCLDYGGSAVAVARNLEIDQKTAQMYIDKYFEGFYGLHTYDQAVVKFAKTHGYVKTLGGHKRHLWDINSSDRKVSSYLERVAVNVLSQGSGADVAMFAQLDIDSDPVLKSIGAYMVMNIHDEVAMICPTEYKELCMERLKFHMENCMLKRGIHLTYNLKAVPGYGKSYFEAKYDRTYSMADIKKLIKDINKKFGANAIRLGSDIKQDMNFKIPLGSVGLNDALGGGLPSGRYITLAGQESSGKSFLAYKAIATVQAMKKKTVTDSSGFEYEIVAEDGNTPLQAALIQIESGSYTKEWGDYLGIDNDSLIFCQPEGMEQALDIAIALQQAGVEFIVIDSIAAMLPTKEIETDLVDTVQMGLRAKALNSYHGKFQSFNNTLERTGRIPTTVLAINQFRDKIGGYGDTTTTPGGNSQKYTNSLEIRTRVGDYLKEGTGANAEIVGRVVKWKIQKNKTGAAFVDGEYDFYTKDGMLPKGTIDTAKELVVLAIVKGVVERRGAWYFYNGVQVAQGQDNLIQKLREDREMFLEIVGKL